MFTLNDEKTLEKRRVSKEKIQEQLNSFVTGFPYLKIISAAEPHKGIIQIKDDEMISIVNEWEKYSLTNVKIQKFVPASGAASRMFKDLFEFIEGNNSEPVTAFEHKFFQNIEKFAFYDDLNNTCLATNNNSISELITQKKYKAIVENLLLNQGLNYGALPKGLLRFHNYPSEKRTPAQEHLVEGALYASALGKVNIHFTVSSEHRILFENHIAATLSDYESKYKVVFNVEFSEQKPSTDTIAADENNQPFRNNGELLFRPGGHGALIENLNDLDGDIIFIKNIDNVVPDGLKTDTIKYKKLIAGLLVKLQKQSFTYLKELENESITPADLKLISEFCEKKLNNFRRDIASLSSADLRLYLIEKLNRPIRVCGMVKNEGEPGGGPFLTVNSDGTVSPQILESSQIDLNNSADKAKMLDSTHFNPVDLVCGIKNYKGVKFDLLKHIDIKTGFISLKSKSGKELKALELPGLWNGAMSDWNTIFVEVPVSTFNPVKTVNDLLKDEHQ